MADVTLKQKEAKTLKFTVTDRAGDAVDLSAATVKFCMKKAKSDTSYLIEKADGDFDKTDAACGIVKVDLSATDTNQTPGNYIGELKTTFASDNIDLSADISVKIDQAVITD